MSSRPSQPQRESVAAIYCRVSTRGQEEEGTSLASQEEACRAFAAARGFAVDERHIYRETFSGAKLWERPQLSAMREAVRGGEVGAIVAYDLDRLSRDQNHIAILDDECGRHGAALLLVTEVFEQTSVGKVIRSVKAFAAELEREKIRERTVRGRKAVVLAGKLHNAGVDLYGYRKDRQARVRHVHEPEAAVVRQMYRWVAEEGRAIRWIARTLNDRGIPAPAQGKVTFGDGRTPRWGWSQVHRLLVNPNYKGEGVAWRHAPRDSHTSYRPEDEWVRLPEGVTPAIVPPALWQAAQERLRTNKGDETRNETTPYLLRGHITCAKCGLRLFAETTNAPVGGGRKKLYRYYRCASRARDLACDSQLVPADAIEAWVWTRVGAALRDPSIITRQATAARERGPDPHLAEDREVAARSVEKLTQQLQRLVRRLREADDDLADLIEKEIASVEEDLRRARAALAEAEALLADQQVEADQLAALAEYCARVGANLEDFDFERKRLALKAFDIQVRASGREDGGLWQIRGSVPLVDFGAVTRASASPERRSGPPRPR